MYLETISIKKILEIMDRIWAIMSVHTIFQLGLLSNIVKLVLDILKETINHSALSGL